MNLEILERDESPDWRDAACQDQRRFGVPEVVSFRMDFPAWLAQLGEFKALAARLLALGTSTGEASRCLGVSPARISQLRRELRESWEAFVGDHAEVVVAAS